MSKRSRMNKLKKAEAQRKRQEQQAALNSKQGGLPVAVVGEGAAKRASISQLVLQKMGGMGIIQAVDAANGVQAPGKPLAPTIKVTPLPDGRLPTVIAPPQPEGKWPDHWPRCPATCDPGEWRRALENKEYYELKHIEDDGKKPWFQYPRYNYQYSEFVYCTPDMMLELLKYMPINRPMKQSWVDAISRDVLNDRWLQTHESIAINKAGNMHDGQHRATGIVQAKKGWPIYITWGVPPESLYVTDSGEKRKINEKLGLLFPESKLTHKTAALCRSMMWGLSARGIRYSESEIAEFAVKHHDVILWVASNLRSYRADLQAVIAKALLWWGETVVGPFVHRLKTVEFQGDGDPAKALYLWLAKAKQEGRRASYTGPLIYYKKALAAIHAAATNKDSKKIYQKQDDIFEWLPGWEVPPGTPCGGIVLLPQSEESLTSAADDASEDEETE